MQFTLRLTLDNAAFDSPNGDEIARILRKLARSLEGSDVGPDVETGEPTSDPLFDINGNRCGTVSIEE